MFRPTFTAALIITCAGIAMLTPALVHASPGLPCTGLKVTASDAEAADRFGESVAVSGDIAVVGADGDDDAGIAAGAAYVLSRNMGGPDNWGEVKKLIASDAADYDFLGQAVAVSGDIALVGAPNDDDAGESSGSAYVYDLHSCDCPADTNGDGVVGVEDLIEVVLAWGSDDESADVTNDGIVDVEDLVQLILAWGPCS